MLIRSGRRAALLAVAVLVGLVPLVLTTPSAEASTDLDRGAAAWAQRQTGSQSYKLLCLKFVYDAYINAGMSRSTLDRQAGYVSNGNTYPIDEWTYWTSGHLPAGQLHQGYDAAPPVGAIIYFSNRLGHDYSHATISLGGGQQISPDTGSVSAPQSVDTNNFRTMLGWWLPDEQGGDPAPVLHSSVTASNNAGQLAVQVHDFPLGTAYFFCHQGDPTDFPAGGAITGRGSVNVTSHDQSWSSGWCSGTGNSWVGVQGSDKGSYYSNQVALGTAPPGVVAQAAGGVFSVRLQNFPLGTSYYFCHAGSADQYPTGGTITARGSVVVTAPDQSFSGWCGGTGPIWVGVQAADQGSYYSLPVTVTPAITVPSEPLGVDAVAGDAAAAVYWSPPASDGGTAITGYRVTAWPGGQTCSTDGARSCVVDGLVNGQPTSFVVVASNTRGDGPASGSSSPVTPSTTPAAPGALVASPGDGSVRLDWAAPDDHGSPVLGYAITTSPATSETDTTATSAKLDGLDDETTYTFVVRAWNANGTGDAAVVVATPKRASTCSSPGSPVTTLRAPSTMSAGTDPAVAVRTTWRASATTCAYELQVQDADGGGWTEVYRGSATSTDWNVHLGVLQATRVRAVDGDGVAGGWAIAVAQTVSGQPDVTAASGPFKLVKSSRYWGGSARSTKKSGASLTATVTGRSIAVVTRVGPDSGSVRVYVDGHRVAAPSTYARSKSYRHAIASWTGEYGEHKVTIVNRATKHHPAMVVDGVLSL